MRKVISLSERFWSKVERGDKCWEWQASRNRGYGQIVVNGRPTKAHRVAYELACGPIPDGLLVCHRCDNPSCVRPDHLFLGTSLDNNHDMALKGRCRKEGYPGEDNPCVKLARSDVERIRYLYSIGFATQTELATWYEVSQSNISRIVRHELWSDVEGY